MDDFYAVAIKDTELFPKSTVTKDKIYKFRYDTYPSLCVKTYDNQGDEIILYPPGHGHLFDRFFIVVEYKNI